MSDSRCQTVVFKPWLSNSNCQCQLLCIQRIREWTSAVGFFCMFNVKFHFFLKQLFSSVNFNRRKISSFNDSCWPKWKSNLLPTFFSYEQRRSGPSAYQAVDCNWCYRLAHTAHKFVFFKLFVKPFVSSFEIKLSQLFSL